MNILVVDDERDTRELVRDLLLEEGHSVTLASSAVEALCHVQMTRFALILLDIMMPGMDGHQVAHAVTTNWRTFDVPILILSCRTDAESKGWARVNGCAGYIEKPFSAADLLSRVRKIERIGQE